VLLPHGTLILVMDGGALRLLRNAGLETAPRLELVASRTFAASAAHKFQGGRPVRVFESVGPVRHGVEAPPWQRRGEEEFAAGACALLLKHLSTGPGLVVIAPPRMLGALRAAYPREIADHVTAEVGKDWTHHQPAEIGRMLQRHRD